MVVRARNLLIGLAGLAALGGAGTAGYMAGARMAEAPGTRLTLATCGLVPAPPPLHLSLSALKVNATAPGMTLGPILHPGLDAPLSLRFRALEATETPQPVLTGTLLELPVDVDRPPDALHLSCRHGAVARVEYRRGPLRLVLDVASAPGATAADDGGSVASGPHPADLSQLSDASGDGASAYPAAP